MSTMASQITSLAIVYLTVYSGADQGKKSKHRVTGLCVGNSPVTSEFPAQIVALKMFLFADVIISEGLIDLARSWTQTNFYKISV